MHNLHFKDVTLMANMGKEIRRTFGIALLSLFWAIIPLTAAIAQNPTPNPVGRLSDFANVIDDANRQNIEKLISDLETRTSAEMAVVTIDSLKGDSIDDYANRLFSQWGIGKKKKDNGLLLLVAVRDQKLRIEVGYGLEGTIPDGFAGDVIRNTIVPYFKQGRFGDGIYAGALRLAQRIETEAGVTLSEQQPPPPPGAAARTPDPYGRIFTRLFTGIAAIFMIIPILFIIAVIVAIVAAIRLATTCPRCKKRMIVDSHVLSEPTWWTSGKRFRKRTCSFCGFHDEHVETIPRRSMGSSFGSSGGWSSGGGGFSGGGGGGGFGGGSSGGGGASGSW